MKEFLAEIRRYIEAKAFNKIMMVADDQKIYILYKAGSGHFELLHTQKYSLPDIELAKKLVDDIMQNPFNYGM